MEKLQSKYPPVDTTDDSLMVRLNLRQPEATNFSKAFSKTAEEKQALKLSKKQYNLSKQLKTK